MEKRYYLNPAIGKFAGDARHQWRRRISTLQSVDNKAYSVNLPIPKGKENEKKQLHLNDERIRLPITRQLIDITVKTFFIF